MKRLASLALLLFAVPALSPAEEAAKPVDKAALVAAAREIMAAQTYCALVTIDETGRPSVRTMNPFPPEDDMSVWMATTTKSRKYAEIQRNPRVTLYYANHADATGYVSLVGRAVIVEDMQEVLKRKRAYWDQAFPGLKNIALIHIIPERLEVVYYKAGLHGAQDTFAPTAIAPPTRKGAPRSRRAP